jgi:hypothetical protein
LSARLCLSASVANSWQNILASLAEKFSWGTKNSIPSLEHLKFLKIFKMKKTFEKVLPSFLNQKFAMQQHL